MSPSAFLDRATPPGDRPLAATLGKAAPLWVQLRAELDGQFTPLTDTWRFSGKSHGWILQLRQKRRTVLYLVPCQGHFVASFALNENACRAARSSGIPSAVLAIIATAPEYPEGRGVRLEVRTKADVKNVFDLATLKMMN